MRAYAKINLGLQILNKRDDGYHEIETVLHPVDIFDTIEFKDDKLDVVIECSDPSVPIDESSLCWQAVDAIRREMNITKGVRIFIDKKIPVGAGLGGGSSDAAFLLRELPKFWKLTIDQKRLQNIAASLGSDVPYFLLSGTALATGRGEILEYFDFSLPYWTVVVYPNVEVSTKWAYEQFRFNESRQHVNLKELLLQNVSNPRIWVNKLRNDFEGIVFGAHEAVRHLKAALYRAGADFAQMSGSGSAVYGLFHNEKSARNVGQTIGENQRVYITEPNFTPT